MTAPRSSSPLALLALSAALFGCGGGAEPSAAPASGSTGSVASSSGASGGTSQGGDGGATSSAAGANAGGSITAGSGGTTASSGAGGQTHAGGCRDVDVDELRVFSPSWDPLGYPPYALEGCRLVYIAPEDGGGTLHFRDLSTGEESRLEPAAAKPRRPALAGDVMAWEVEESGKRRVRVSYRGSQATLGADFESAGEPRVTADAVVFTAFLGSSSDDDTDVYLYQVESAALSLVAGGPGQQRFADVSSSHVAVTDFSEDPRGYFDEQQSLADVLLVERSSGTKLTRAALGKQAFPLLGSDGALAYLEWGEVHPEPKFSQYWLKIGSSGQGVEHDRSVTPEPLHTEPAYVRPSLRHRSLDFVDTRAGNVALYRATLGSDEPPVPVALDASGSPLGPVAAEHMTLIATRAADQSLSLHAIAR